MAEPTRTDLAAEVIRVFAESLDVTLDRLASHIADDVPELEHAGPELLAHVRRASAAELRAGIVGYDLERTLPSSPPVETGELARYAARDQLPLTALLRIYAVARTVYWEAIYDAMVSPEPPRPVLLGLVREGTVFLNDFMDQISTLAATEYAAERERSLHRSRSRRQAAIRDVLEGAHSAGSVLRYPLGVEHIGLVASGAGADHVVGRLTDLPEITVLASPSDEVLWAWLHGPESKIVAAVESALEAADPGTRVGLGKPTQGADGFRATHRQAAAAYRLAVTLDRPVVQYSEVAVEDLAGRDTAAADHFVREELGPLLQRGERGEQLLETIEVFLAAGQNGTSAAARLGLGQRAVSHRLRDAERLLGVSLAERSCELQLALRLRHLIAATRDDEARRHSDATAATSLGLAPRAP